MACSRRSIGWIACVVGVWLVSATAGAEMLRCTGPDGRTIFTDNRALCPGAEPMEPKKEPEPGRDDGWASSDGDVVVDGPAAPSHRDRLAERLRRVRQREAAFAAEEGEAKRWKRKQEQLRSEVERIEQRREFLARFVTNCNRGGLVYTRDASGVKKTIRCKDIQKQYAALDDEEAQARAALAGLPEECRKAGCLPGWLRD